MVDLLPNIEQQQIVDTVAALLDDLSPVGRLRGQRPAMRLTRRSCSSKGGRMSWWTG